MNKLSENKINEIINHAIQHWTHTFGTKNRNTHEAYIGLKNFITMINNSENIGYFGDGKIDTMRNQALEKVKSILTNAYNKGLDYWSEGLLHQVAHRVYQEKLSLIQNQNKQLLIKINELNNSSKKNISLNINDKIDQILKNLDINFIDNISLENKIDNITEFTNTLSNF
ncbi:21222_t:CDS:2 [Cetraspora pellucida]|uniref:21222_t:CDS:1 n=1 Tax=Cetraspora pellucida TaxID=1433469 RepID=A0A9N9I6E4_9GLOM|nr:21222_t:CDS:2 [Cetraspora pellucida]